MSKFIPNKEHSRAALIFCFHLKKTAAESYRLLREAYGEHAPSQDTCERWFRRFKSGNFDVTDKEHGKPPKKYEDVELQALLDEDDSQTQKQLAEQLGVSQQAVSNRLRKMGKIQKTGRWTNINVNRRNFSGNTALHTAVVTPGAKAKEICTLLLEHGANPYIRNYDRESNNTEGKKQVGEQTIKTEVLSEDENMKDCAGQSSFDLASNKPDILQFVSNQNAASPEKIIKCKDEDIDDMQKVWMDADQEKQLAAILDETKGWKKLAHHFNFEYLLSTFERSATSSTLLLLNYIAIQTDISLSELQIILQGLGEEDAALYVEQILFVRA